MGLTRRDVGQGVLQTPGCGEPVGERRRPIERRRPGVFGCPRGIRQSSLGASARATSHTPEVNGESGGEPPDSARRRSRKLRKFPLAPMGRDSQKIVSGREPSASRRLRVKLGQEVGRAQDPDAAVAAQVQQMTVSGNNGVSLDGESTLQHHVVIRVRWYGSNPRGWHH